MDICLDAAEWLKESQDGYYQFVAFGRTLASRSSRDSSVFIGDDDVVMRVKNVPLPLYEQVTKESSEGLTIVKEQEYDKDALLSEKKMLLSRIDEIDNLLNAQ